MLHSHGYAAMKAKGALAPFAFERRDPGPTDVVLEIRYCGVCHSDIHQVNSDLILSGGFTRMFRLAGFV